MITPQFPLPFWRWCGSHHHHVFSDCLLCCFCLGRLNFITNLTRPYVLYKSFRCSSCRHGIQQRICSTDWCCIPSYGELLMMPMLDIQSLLLLSEGSSNSLYKSHAKREWLFSFWPETREVTSHARSTPLRFRNPWDLTERPEFWLLQWCFISLCLHKLNPSQNLANCGLTRLTPGHLVLIVRLSSLYLYVYFWPSRLSGVYLTNSLNVAAQLETPANPGNSAGNDPKHTVSQVVRELKFQCVNWPVLTLR